MLSVYTRAQIAIAVLHDLSSSKVLQPVKFLLQNEEWKDLLNKLEKVQLIRLLPNKETRIRHSCISPWQYNHVIQRLWTL